METTTTSSALMALEGEEVDLYKLNSNWTDVDALSYIDPLTEDAAAEAKRLVQQELQTMGVLTNSTSSSSSVGPEVHQNYLSSLPLPPTPTMDRLCLEYKNSSAAVGGVDMSRYNDIDPASNASSTTEWKSCLERGEMLLEYSTSGLQNLELMQMNCQKMWLKHIADAQTHETMLRREVEKLRNEIEQTNKRRKLEQVSAGNDLRRLMRKREEKMERTTRVLVAKLSGLNRRPPPT
eukprot:GHVS01011637.1.p1 GENE.GHVS01011637.1~~GHVS01011637.1.p1  ORF type:complete len:236 (+),score=58.61 GHVS01011637.1:175-882(+)